MRSEKIVPDSTFFSFFIHNTDNSDYLEKIVNNFNFEVAPKVSGEMSKCKYYPKIKVFSHKMHIFENKLGSFSELLKPLFSKEEKERGEHDVLVVGFMCFQMKLDFILIIDDLGARKFILKNFDYLEKNLEWTANFLKRCYVSYKIFKKEETLNLLRDMGNSNFRIKKEILDKLIEEVQNE
jgi:hypothetical protein